MFLFLLFYTKKNKQSAQNIAPNPAFLVQTSQSESSLSTNTDYVDNMNLKKSKSNFDLPTEPLVNVDSTTDEEMSDYNVEEARRIEEELKKRLAKEKKKKEEKNVRARSRRGNRRAVTNDDIILD